MWMVVLVLFWARVAGSVAWVGFWVGRVSAATVVWELSERLVRNTIPAVHSTSTTAARISVIRSRLASACCFLRWASRFSRRIFISSSCSGMASSSQF